MLELVPAKSILARNKDPRWFGIDYQMNLYRGCCHGCIYCDSRSECYGIEEFDRVRGKKNALALLEEELRHKRKTGVAATGAMSDPYNPYESEAELTRGGLKLLDQYGFGAAVATKSARITRDLDVLKRIQSHSPVLCKITVTTCDDELCRKLEPYPSVTSERMEAVRILSGAGIFTGLLLMPVLPFLEDSLDNLLGIVRLGAENGARFIYPAFGVTLRQNQREYFYDQLEKRFPGEDLARRYQEKYGSSYVCRARNAKILGEAFRRACRKEVILYTMTEIIKAYRAPYDPVQTSLF